MPAIKFNFKGLMVPVFTAFTTDKTRVNYDNIDKYAQFLKQKGVNGVLVNGTTGEGTCLRVDERKRLAEEWLTACRRQKLTCMVQIGGASIADVIDLAEHAEKIGVDAILCLPDLFFRPNTEEDLVHYLREIAETAPTRPILYYHIPELTRVNLSMPRLCEIAERTIATFSGIKYTSGDLNMGAACLKLGRNVLLGCDTVLSAGLILGFEAAILTSLNIVPEHVIQIYEAMRQQRLPEAIAGQEKLNNRINTILGEDGNWVEKMKAEFNRVNATLHAGPLRKPLQNIHTKRSQ